MMSDECTATANGGRRELGGFLWMFVVAALCLSIDAYSLVTRSLGLSALHMLPLFAIGLVAGLVWLRPHDAVRRAWGVWGVLIGFIMLLTTHCLFLHPDLVFSRVGALMMSPYQLTTGRAFPMLLAPLLLGLSAGAVLPRTRWMKLLSVTSPLVLIGFVAIWGTFSIRGIGLDVLFVNQLRLVVAVSWLGMFMLLAVLLALRIRRESGRTPMPIVATCSAGMFLVAALVDPYGGRAALRREFAGRVAGSHSVAVSPADVSSSAFHEFLFGSEASAMLGKGSMYILFRAGEVEGGCSRGSWTSATLATSDASVASVEVVAALTVATRVAESIKTFCPSVVPGFFRRWRSVESRAGWQNLRVPDAGPSAVSDLFGPRSARVFGPGSLAGLG